MPAMWWKLIKIMLLLCALFATLPAQDIEERVRVIFKVHDGQGLQLFDTTTTTTNEAASFMPIPTMLGDQPADSQASETESQSQSQSHIQSLSVPETENKSKHYHQYQSLNHQQQSFKVQRSPDGKLNLVFNDPIVSLQSTKQQQPQQPQQQQPQQPQRPRVPPSDNKYRQNLQPPIIDPGYLQCADGFNQSRSFCTKVANYPDLSGLKHKLNSSDFSSLFVDQPVPTEFGLRMNDDEQYLCNSHVRYLYPKLGQRADHTWQYIVNTDEFKQGILIEECENENKNCQFLDSFPNNYVPICKQHYVLRQLATINNVSSGQPEVTSEAFKIPSCCKCVIKSKFSIDNLNSTLKP